MGHNIEHEIYPENVNKKNVQAYWDDHAAHADRGEGCTGLGSNIRWLDEICASEQEAYDYLAKVDRGWYDQIAVRFRQADKPSVKLADLQKRYREADAALAAMVRDVHYSHTTTKFVGCKHCGSSIARTFLKGNFCPVCNHDLRPQSVLDKIARAREKVRKLEWQVEEEQKKVNQKGKLLWLVKIEYHT